MSDIVTVLGIIALIVVVMTGLSGHLIHLKPETFGKYNSLHMYIGTASTGLVVVLVIVMLLV